MCMVPVAESGLRGFVQAARIRGSATLLNYLLLHLTQVMPRGPTVLYDDVTPKTQERSVLLGMQGMEEIRFD